MRSLLLLTVSLGWATAFLKLYPGIPTDAPDPSTFPQVPENPHNVRWASFVESEFMAMTQDIGGTYTIDLGNGVVAEVTVAEFQMAKDDEGNAVYEMDATSETTVLAVSLKTEGGFELDGSYLAGFTSTNFDASDKKWVIIYEEPIAPASPLPTSTELLSVDLEQMYPPPHCPHVTVEAWSYMWDCSMGGGPNVPDMKIEITQIEAGPVTPPVVLMCPDNTRWCKIWTCLTGCRFYVRVIDRDPPPGCNLPWPGSDTDLGGTMVMTNQGWVSTGPGTNTLVRISGCHACSGSMTPPPLLEGTPADGGNTAVYLVGGGSVAVASAVVAFSIGRRRRRYAHIQSTV